jgi:hypothetical protein
MCVCIYIYWKIEKVILDFRNIINYSRVDPQNCSSCHHIFNLIQQKLSSRYRLKLQRFSLLEKEIFDDRRGRKVQWIPLGPKLYKS